MSQFTLHPRLEAETCLISDLRLSQLRLQNQKAVPWMILVPRRTETELYQLSKDDRALLMDEIAQVSEILKELYMPHKINVATLGNMVPQMHVHVVGRYKDDPAWPAPVWGRLDPAPYTLGAIKEIKEKWLGLMIK